MYGMDFAYWVSTETLGDHAKCEVVDLNMLQWPNLNDL